MWARILHYIVHHFAKEFGLAFGAAVVYEYAHEGIALVADAVHALCGG